ncbi:excinuclease ABC subunit UvrC [candidate division KSB1 bacterium]
MPLQTTENIENKLNTVPARPGVYRFKDKAGEILYIGKAKSLKSRVRSYFQESGTVDPKVEILRRKITDFDYLTTHSEIEALILEANLIKEHAPRYNVQLRDDKKYPFIKITLGETFPRIFWTREVAEDGSRYFGPYTNARAMRRTLEAVKNIFHLRSRSGCPGPQPNPRPCLDYQIGRCLGTCIGSITPEDYRKVVDEVMLFLSGKASRVLSRLKKRMAGASDDLRFEEAAAIRDRIKSMESVIAGQQMVLQTPEDLDMVAVAVEGRDACGMVLQIRDGKLIGREHRLLKCLSESTEAEVLASFVKQYYTRTPFLPGEIDLERPIEEMEAVTDWLSRTGEGEGEEKRRVKLHVPQRGKRRKLTGLAARNAFLILEEYKIGKKQRSARAPQALVELGRHLRLPGPPGRIEAYDISTIMGQDSVGSMVVFENGRARKSDYRLFRIKTVEGQDDFAMMREVLTRRMSHLRDETGRWNLKPDLIIIDGGKGQLSAAASALTAAKMSGTPIIGLAKRLEEIYFPQRDQPITLPLASPALRILKAARDEAHRFAINYHKKLRATHMVSSALDRIQGIGKAKKLHLLRHFDSLEAIKQAEVAELVQVKGITARDAENVHSHFHQPSEQGSING